MKSSLLRSPVLCFALLALAACGKGQEQAQQPPPPEVGVITAQPQSAPLTKDLVGRLSAYRSADVRARVSGVLLKRVYQEGTDVKQGQLLFQIDPATYRATLNSSIANLASAKASYANAHVAAERDRSLVPKGYISRAQLDTDEATERSAAAGVQQAQAAVANSQISLGYTNVVSPISGRAGQQQVTEGAIVGNSTVDSGSGSTLLTTVDQLDPLYVNFTLSSSDFNQLRTAQTSGNVTLTDQAQTHVEVSLPDGTKYDQQGTLDFSDTSVSQNTGAISLRALLPNPQRVLLPGQYVTLKANLGERNKVFLIPQQAILRDTSGAYALTVVDGKAVRKNVDADQSTGNNWIIGKGLAAGDQVIVSGLPQVQEGAPVKASPWQPNQAAGKPGDKPAANPAAKQ